MSKSRLVLQVEGMDCPNEVAAIRAALTGQEGIFGLEFDLLQGRVTVEHEPGKTAADDIIARVRTRTGLKASRQGGPAVKGGDTGDTASSQRESGAHCECSSECAGSQVQRGFSRGRLDRWLLALITGFLVAGGLLSRLIGGAPEIPQALWLITSAIGVYFLLPKAFRALRSRRLDMHVLMTLAIMGALALGEWEEAATVTFLFCLSLALESASLERARGAVRQLLDLQPETAEVYLESGDVRGVAAREVRVGQIVRVRAGNRIPIDGQVVRGASAVDQKSITGESIPVHRAEGDEVFAGTVVGEGTLDVRATRALDDSLVTRIVDQVRDAQAGRAPVERIIERFAAVYTPAVVLIAVLVMLLPPLAGRFLGASVLGFNADWATWIERGLVFLVIACPCALVIGTPVAVVTGLTMASRRGILIKGGQFLEEIGQVKVLAFDKTGTLTEGNPDVVEVVPASGGCDREVLRIAAALGDEGGHLLGRAIARFARNLRLDVPKAQEYRAVPGLGATGVIGEGRYHIGSHRYIDEVGLCEAVFHDSLSEAEGREGTAVVLTGGDGPLGWIRLADQARPEAWEALESLKELGLRLVMLTGDNQTTARAMAGELGITEYKWGMLPGEKAGYIASLEAAGERSGMVGDGVNDAPALATARLSVAMGGLSSSGAALDTADIVLMSSDLKALPWLVRHSRRTLARIRQNIAIAIGSKGFVMLLAALGAANMWMAIAADTGISLLVVANALRLMRSP